MKVAKINNLIESIAKENHTLPLLFHSENNRKQYQEYILRFFALKNFNECSSSLKKTMNDYMAKNQNLDKTEIDKLKTLFNFELEKPTNIALKNTVSSMLQEHSDEGVSFNFEPKKLEVIETSKQDIDSAKLGTIYHNIMQQINFESLKIEDENEINEIIKKLNIDEKYLNYIDVKRIKTCVEILKELNIKYSLKEQPFLSYVKYNSIFKNSKISDKILIQGVADLIVKTTDNKIYLIDYKTTKASKPDQLVDKYSLQLNLYVTCLEKALNIKIDNTYIYSFYLNKLIKIN